MEEIQFAAVWEPWPQPRAPVLPPHLINFQAWLAAEGLQVQDWILPDDNTSDSAAQAWNDSITVADNSCSGNADLTLATFPAHQIQPIYVEDNHQDDMVTIFVAVHNSGLQFNLSTQGDHVASLILTDTVPARQLNTILATAIRPLLATYGPWNARYGL